MAGGVDQIDQEGVGFFYFLGDVRLIFVRQGVKEGDCPKIIRKTLTKIPEAFKRTVKCSAQLVVLSLCKLSRFIPTYR